MTLGCDPGAITGFAVIHRGALQFCKQYRREAAIEKVIDIAMRFGCRRAVIERPRMGLLYEHRKDTSDAVKIKITQNVGQNIALSDTLGVLLKREGLQVDFVSPSRTSTKWTPNIWRSVFTWGDKLPGEHARDAAIIAYLNERGAVCPQK